MQIELATFLKCSIQILLIRYHPEKCFFPTSPVARDEIKREVQFAAPQFVLGQHEGSNPPSVLFGITLLEEKATFSLNPHRKLSRGSSALKKVLTSTFKTSKTLPSNGVL